MPEPLPITRCLHCCLACPLSFRADPPAGATAAAEEVAVEYAPGDDAQGRLCWRAHCMAEMASHPLRLVGAEAGRGKPVPVGEALGLARERLAGAGARAAVLVDANLPTEAIAAALRLGREALGTERAAACLPATDAAMLRGLADGPPVLALEGVAKRDALLVVGDAFATHPVLAGRVLDAKQMGRAALFGLDCARNRVAGFSDAFLLVRPGGEAFALAALCALASKPLGAEHPWADGRSAGELAAAAGVEESALRQVAERLSRAERPAVLLAPVAGRMANVAAAAAAASALCEAAGAMLMPLFASGNAFGAAGAAAGLRAPLSSAVLRDALDGQVEALLCVGVDALALVRPEDAERLRRRVPTLAAASAFPNRTTAAADVTLPLALWFEQSGTVGPTGGGALPLERALAPPGDAMTVAELCAGLAPAGAGREPAPAPNGAEVQSVGAGFKPAPTSADAPELAGEALLLVARPDGLWLGGGDVSRVLAWPRYAEPSPELLMNPADLAARGLAPKAPAKLRANHAEAAVHVRPSPDMPPGVIAVSTAFAATRALFPLRKDGAGVWETSPALAEVMEDAP